MTALLIASIDSLVRVYVFNLCTLPELFLKYVSTEVTALNIWYGRIEWLYKMEMLLQYFPWASARITGCLILQNMFWAIFCFLLFVVVNFGMIIIGLYISIFSSVSYKGSLPQYSVWQVYLAPEVDCSKN